MQAILSLQTVSVPLQTLGRQTAFQRKPNPSQSHALCRQTATAAMWRGRRRGSTDPYAVIIFFRLAQQIAQLENKPPVTLAAIAACFLAYFSDEVVPPHLRPAGLDIKHGCLQPYLIVQNRQWGRLIWSALLHADEVHLCYNMASFLYKGTQLEPRLGSPRFAALLLELLLLSHCLVVAASAAASSRIPEYRYLWFSSCAVGFSAVIFALKVVLFHDSPGHSSVLGFTLPTKYLAWAELLLASAFNPRASFLGHLCGILAGLLHVKYLVPGAARLLRFVRQQQAAASRRAATAAAAAGRQQPGPRRPPTATAGGAAAGGGLGPSAAGAPGSTAAAAAAAAQQRIQAQQQGGIPASRGLQQRAEQRVGGAGVDNDDGEGGAVGGGSRVLSAEELRLRRLQRFS